MVAVKPAEIRNNQKDFYDKAYQGETVVVSRPRKENVVIISESKYNELQQAIRLVAYYKGMTERGLIKDGLGLQDMLDQIEKSEGYFVNRIGSTVMITPKENLEDTLYEGAAMLPDDFMEDGRPSEVPVIREEL